MGGFAVKGSVTILPVVTSRLASYLPARCATPIGPLTALGFSRRLSHSCVIEGMDGPIPGGKKAPGRCSWLVPAFYQQV